MSAHQYNPNGLYETMARVETKLDASLEQIKDQEKRITTLERWRYWTLGTAAAASGGAVKVWQWLSIGPKPPVH